MKRSYKKKFLCGKPAWMCPTFYDFGNGFIITNISWEKKLFHENDVILDIQHEFMMVALITEIPGKTM